MALQPLMVGLVLVSNGWNVGTNCEERQMVCFEALRIFGLCLHRNGKF